MAIKRILNLSELLSQKSHFLLGPRSTGKSTLIKETLLPQWQYINLLHSETRLRLTAHPEALRGMLSERAKGVVIDEIQKIPELLDEVHSLIEDHKVKFLLTGSSARKLRRDGVNLLAGRARTAHLHGFVSAEIPGFDLDRALHLGTLPAVHTSAQPWDDLKAYVDTYLKEEIMEEAATRNLGAFIRFLQTAALQNAQLVNFSGVASDAQVKLGTVRGYYQILADTLLGEVLDPWVKSKKRKAIATGKFYFFDTGVTHALCDVRALPESSDLYGRALESFVLQELRAYVSYRRTHQKITYWRSVNHQEVDFCVGDDVAIEVKAKTRVGTRDIKGLLALGEEKAFKRYILVSRDEMRQKIEGVECFSVADFLKTLWSDGL